MQTQENKYSNPLTHQVIYSLQHSPKNKKKPQTNHRGFFFHKMFGTYETFRISGLRYYPPLQTYGAERNARKPTEPTPGSLPKVNLQVL